MPQPKAEVVKHNDGSAYLALSGDVEGLKLALAENIGDDTLTEFDITRVKVPTGGGTMWTVPVFDGEESVKEIEGIIVKWYNRRAYWEGKFSGGNEPPQCASVNGIVGEGNPGGACAECPYAQFGSSTNEDSPNSQACKAFRLMFVLTPDAMLPTVLVLPATSLKNARQYMFKLSSANLPHTGVTTKFVLEKDKSASGYDYSKVLMTPGERLSDEARQKVKDYASALMPSFERVTVTRSDVAGDSADF